MTKQSQEPSTKKKVTKKAAATPKASAHSHDGHDHKHDHAGHDHAGHDHTHADGSNLISDNTKITLTLPWADVHKAYQAQLKKYAQNLKTDGFRKGKVPLDLAEKMIDRTKLIQATLEKVVPEVYGKAIEAGKYEPLTQPDFEPKSLEWNQDWTVEAQFAEHPEVSIKDYKKLIAKGKKEAEKTWKEQQEAKKKAEKKADKKDAKSEAPKKTKEQEEAAKKEHTLHAIFKHLVTELKPAIPELLIRDHTRQELQELEQQLKRVNATIEQFLQQRGQSFNDLTQELAAQTLGKLQLEFVLRKIQEDLKISVTDAEITAEYDSLMSGYMKQMPAEQQEAAKKQMPPMSDSSKEYIQRTLERRKLLDTIMDM